MPRGTAPVSPLQHRLFLAEVKGALPVPAKPRAGGVRSTSLGLARKLRLRSGLSRNPALLLVVPDR